MHFYNKNDHDGNVFWKLPLWRAIPGSRYCVLHTDENVEVFLLRAHGKDDIDTISNFLRKFYDHFREHTSIQCTFNND